LISQQRPTNGSTPQRAPAWRGAEEVKGDGAKVKAIAEGGVKATAQVPCDVSPQPRQLTTHFNPRQRVNFNKT